MVSYHSIALNGFDTSSLLMNQGSFEQVRDGALLASLVDPCEFEEDGLLKKTMTVAIHDTRYHPISYYSLQSTRIHLLTPPTDERLKHLSLDLRGILVQVH